MILRDVLVPTAPVPVDPKAHRSADPSQGGAVQPHAKNSVGLLNPTERSRSARFFCSSGVRICRCYRGRLGTASAVCREGVRHIPIGSSTQSVVGCPFYITRPFQPCIPPSVSFAGSRSTASSVRGIPVISAATSMIGRCCL